MTGHRCVLAEISEEEAIQRAAIATLNSVQVAKGVVTFRRPRGVGQRFLDMLTGKQRRLDELFDGHVANAIEGLHGFVGILRDRMAESDVVLAKAISVIRSVRSAADTNSRSIESLKSELGSLETKLRSELDELWGEVEYATAFADIDLILSRLETGNRRTLLSYSDIWLVFDRIWWGRTGRFLRRLPGSDEAMDMRNRIEIRLREILQARGMAGLFSPASLLEGIPHLQEEQVEQLELLSLDPDWKLRPLTSAVLARGRGEPDPGAEALRLPLVTNGGTIARRLLSEAERGTK